MAVRFGRLILTVTGLVLLVVFGVRAASQASSMAAVRGQPGRWALPLAAWRLPSAAVGSLTGSPALWQTMPSAVRPPAPKVSQPNSAAVAVSHPARSQGASPATHSSRLAAVATAAASSSDGVASPAVPPGRGHSVK